MKRSTSAADAKPVFISTTDRQRLALQRRAALELLQQNHNEAPPNRKDQLPASGSNLRHDTDCDKDWDRERDRKRERDRDRRAARDREQEIEEEVHAREKQAEGEKVNELESIREQYLGTQKPKKRVIKPSEKFRFSFGWEDTEDTFQDMNALNQNPHQARLLFGRGFVAGIDRREQKKEIRRKEGLESTARRKKEAAAAIYDSFDMRVDRHWTQKKLEEMTEKKSLKKEKKSLRKNHSKNSSTIIQTN